MPNSNQLKPGPTLLYKNSVYSGANCVAVAVLPTGEPVEFGSIQHISISSHRDAQRVLPLGRRYPKGFTFGPDLTAGSLVFTTLSEDAMDSIFEFYRARFEKTKRHVDTQRRHGLRGALGLPPFDIIFGLDKGDPGVYTEHSIVIEGVSFVDSSITLGVSRPQVSQEYAFVAVGTTDILPSEGNFELGDDPQADSYFERKLDWK